MIANEVLKAFAGKNILVSGATGLMGTTALLRLKDYPDISVRAAYHNKEPFVFADNI